MRRFGLVLFSLPLLSGCMAHYNVKAVTPAQLNSTPGFVYYLPKPYLVVTNMGLSSVETAATPPSTAAKPKDGKLDATGEQGSSMVAHSTQTISAVIIYLPDVAHPRTVTVSGSIGTFKSSLTLTNGWMLTGVSSEADAKVAETVTAFSGLLGSIAKMGITAKNQSDTEEERINAPFFYLLEMDLESRQLHLVDPGCLKLLLPGNKAVSNTNADTGGCKL